MHPPDRMLVSVKTSTSRDSVSNTGLFCSMTPVSTRWITMMGGRQQTSLSHGAGLCNRSYPVFTLWWTTVSFYKYQKTLRCILQLWVCCLAQAFTHALYVSTRTGLHPWGHIRMVRLCSSHPGTQLGPSSFCCAGRSQDKRNKNTPLWLFVLFWPLLLD